MEREINEIFECKVTLQVKKAKNGCSGCFFLDNIHKECLRHIINNIDIIEDTGPCNTISRSDKTSVIFKQIAITE